jgi:hypothetical protein
MSNPVKLPVLDQTPVIDGCRVVDAVAAGYAARLRSYQLLAEAFALK